MTRDEFADWLRVHCACFTGLPLWLDKVTHGQNAPTREAILGQWYGILRDVDLADAQAASRRMHAGTIEEPKGFDRHPAAIRAACQTVRRLDPRAPRYDAHGNRTYACLQCEDDGRVLILHPETVSAVEAKGFDAARPFCTAVVFCTCAVGDAMSRGLRNVQRYDPNRHCKLDFPVMMDSKLQAALSAWLARRKSARPANYEPAFDEVQS